MITTRKNVRTNKMTSTTEGMVIDNINANLKYAAVEIEQLARTLVFDPMVKPKFGVDKETRDTVERVLAIAKTAAAGSDVLPGCKITISFDYHDSKSVYFHTRGECGHGSIRVTNAFPLFMAICSVSGQKPKRSKALGTNGMPIPLMFSLYYRVELEQAIYTKREFNAVCKDTQVYRSMNCYELLAHAKDVKLVLACTSGRPEYVDWLVHCYRVYNLLGGPNAFAAHNPWARVKYRIAMLQCCNGSKHVVLASYDNKGNWCGNVIWLPGTEADYEAFLTKYANCKMPVLHW